MERAQVHPGARPDGQEVISNHLDPGGSGVRRVGGAGVRGVSRERGVRRLGARVRLRNARGNRRADERGDE
jgi:hypothetical protein